MHQVFRLLEYLGLVRIRNFEQLYQDCKQSVIPCQKTWKLFEVLFSGNKYFEISLATSIFRIPVLKYPFL